MSTRNMKVLVYWTRDEKTGIENLSNVPEHSRFVGAVTPVMFSGDKKYYPAKILLISDDMNAIERKAIEVEEEIAKTKSEPAFISSKRKRIIKKLDSAASEREVSVALGKKTSVPQHLETSHKSCQKSKKDMKIHHALGQNKLDSQVSTIAKKKLFPLNHAQGHMPQDKQALFGWEMDISNNVEGEDLNNAGDENEDTDYLEEDMEEENDEESLNRDHNASSARKRCSCQPCIMLQKYENSPVHLNFLQDLSKLIRDSSSEMELEGNKKYLKLKEIPFNAKQVELVAGRGIFISLTVKEQLKVDFKNKPSSIARETLFALYGREAFQQLTVTGCGTKPGSFTIPTEVLQVVCSFVNRNVSADQALKLSKLTSLINKRAPEWRKSGSPKQQKQSSAKAKANSTTVSEVMSTSPFKVTALKNIESSPSKASPSKAKKASPFKASPHKKKGTPVKNKESTPLMASPPKTNTPVLQGVQTAIATETSQHPTLVHSSAVPHGPFSLPHDGPFSPPPHHAGPHVSHNYGRYDWSSGYGQSYGHSSYPYYQHPWGEAPSQPSGQAPSQQPWSQNPSEGPSLFQL